MRMNINDDGGGGEGKKPSSSVTSGAARIRFRIPDPDVLLYAIIPDKYAARLEELGLPYTFAFIA